VEIVGEEPYMRALSAVAGLLGLLSGAEGAAPAATPPDVAKQFYQMANEGKCADAARLFTAESVEVINRALESPDGFLQFCAGRGGRAPIATLTIKKETQRGDRAQVTIERSYKDGSLALQTDDLVRAGGVWQLSVGENQVTIARKP
jgi:hypothetical protein